MSRAGCVVHTSRAFGCKDCDKANAAKLRATNGQCVHIGPSGIRCTKLAGHERTERVPTHDERPREASTQTDEHPWGDFLRSRARCLKWLRDEMGESPEKTVITMRMDPGQVRSILDHVDASPADFAASRSASANRVLPELGARAAKWIDDAGDEALIDSYAEGRAIESLTALLVDVYEHGAADARSAGRPSNDQHVADMAELIERYEACIDGYKGALARLRTGSAPTTAEHEERAATAEFLAGYDAGKQGIDINDAIERWWASPCAGADELLDLAQKAADKRREGPPADVNAWAEKLASDACHPDALGNAPRTSDDQLTKRVDVICGELDELRDRLDQVEAPPARRSGEDHPVVKVYCDTCSGRGWSGPDPCWDCQGQGFTPEQRRERDQTTSRDDTTTKGETHGTVEHHASGSGIASQQEQPERRESDGGGLRSSAHRGGAHGGERDNHLRRGGERDASGVAGGREGAPPGVAPAQGPAGTLAGPNAGLADAARELLVWDWTSPDTFDWDEVRIDIANLRRALECALPSSCPGGVYPSQCKEPTAFRIVGVGIEARFCVTCHARFETRATPSSLAHDPRLEMLKEARRRIRDIKIKPGHEYALGLAVGVLYVMRDEITANGCWHDVRDMHEGHCPRCPDQFTREAQK